MTTEISTIAHNPFSSKRVDTESGLLMPDYLSGIFHQKLCKSLLSSRHRKKRKKREDERILKGAKVRACKALLEASFINQLEALESEKQQQPRADEREKTFCVVKGSTQRWELFFYAPAKCHVGNNIKTFAQKTVSRLYLIHIHCVVCTTNNKRTNKRNEQMTNKVKLGKSSNNNMDLDQI